MGELLAARLAQFEAGEKPAFVVEYQPDFCGANSAMQELGLGVSAAGVPICVVSELPDGKKAGVQVFACVPKEQAKTINAGDWVKAAVASFGGKGGGRPFQAQASHASLDDGQGTADAAEAFAKSKLAK